MTQDVVDLEIPEEQSPLMNVLIIGVLVILTFGMGCTLTAEDAKKAIRTPKAFVAGITGQYVCLPLIAFCLCKIFAYQPYVALGLIITCSSPGGSSSTFFSYLIRGDVALSLIMTGGSILLAFGMMPLLIFLYSRALHGNADVIIPFFEIFKTLLAVVVPCIAGIFVRARWKHFAQKAEKVSTVIGVLFILAAIIAGFVDNIAMLSLGWQYWLTSFLILPLGFCSGAGIAWLLGLPPHQVRTCGLEVGVQDTIIAIVVVRMSFKDLDMVQALIFPLMCSLFDIVNSVIVWAIVHLHHKLSNHRLRSSSAISPMESPMNPSRSVEESPLNDREADPIIHVTKHNAERNDSRDTDPPSTPVQEQHDHPF